jgi:hypothetical protein
MMRRKKVSPSESPGKTGGSDNGMWSERDQVVLERLIDPIGKEPFIQPFGFLGSEARGLVSAPKSEIYDRSSAFLSAINVTAALVLSAISGQVSAPVDTSQMPESLKVLGTISNTITFPMVAIQICVVMFSTYMLLMLAAHGHSPDVVYRATAHWGNLLGLCQFCIYLPLLLWLIQIVLLAHINLATALERWISTAMVAAVYCAFHLMFGYNCTRAFPRGMWGWAVVTVPWLLFEGRAKADVRRLDMMYRAGMDEGLMHGMDRASMADGGAGEPSTECSPEESQLSAWLDRAIPDLASHSVQRSLLIRALTNQDLDLPALVKAGGLPGGFGVVIEAFRLTLEDDGVELSRGDRLRLATAVMEEALGGKEGTGGAEGGRA